MSHTTENKNTNWTRETRRAFLNSIIHCGGLTPRDASNPLGRVMRMDAVQEDMRAKGYKPPAVTALQQQWSRLYRQYLQPKLGYAGVTDDMTSGVAIAKILEYDDQLAAAQGAAAAPAPNVGMPGPHPDHGQFPGSVPGPGPTFNPGTFPTQAPAPAPAPVPGLNSIGPHNVGPNVPPLPVGQPNAPQYGPQHGPVPAPNAPHIIYLPVADPETRAMVADLVEQVRMLTDAVQRGFNVMRQQQEEDHYQEEQH